MHPVDIIFCNYLDYLSSFILLWSGRVFLPTLGSNLSLNICSVSLNIGFRNVRDKIILDNFQCQAIWCWSVLFVNEIYGILYFFHLKWLSFLTSFKMKILLSLCVGVSSTTSLLAKCVFTSSTNAFFTFVVRVRSGLLMAPKINL